MANALVGERCRVVVVSGRTLVGETIAALVGVGDGFSACAADPSEVEAVVSATEPHIVVVDATDRRTAEEVARTVIEGPSDAKVALLVEEPGVWSDRACKALGAEGSLSCHLSEAEFMRMLSGLHRGERLKGGADRRPTKPSPQGPDQLRVSVLTRREREVLVLLGLGERPEDIADALSISANTVRTHVQNLMLKLAVHSRLEAVALARRAGLLDGHRSKSIHQEAGTDG